MDCMIIYLSFYITNIIVKTRQAKLSSGQPASQPASPSAQLSPLAQLRPILAAADSNLANPQPITNQ